MLEIGGGLDLLEEPPGAEDGGQLGPQHLEGDLAVVAHVVRQVHRGHAALAQLPLDAVAVGEGGGEALGGGRHGSAPSLCAIRRASSGTFCSTTMWSAPARRAKTNQRPSGDTS